MPRETPRAGKRGRGSRAPAARRPRRARCCVRALDADPVCAAVDRTGADGGHARQVTAFGPPSRRCGGSCRRSLRPEAAGGSGDEITSWNSRGLSGPTLTSIVRSPSVNLVAGRVRAPRIFRATGRARPARARSRPRAPDGAKIVTGSIDPSASAARCVISLPRAVARRVSSSRSGSFISQCARRRSSSRCGPPPSKSRAHSQIWSDSSSGDAALALARQHQQRLVVRAGHEHADAARGLDDDLAEPVAPARRIAFGARQAARDRMLLPDVGSRRAEGALDQIAVGPARARCGRAARR